MLMDKNHHLRVYCTGETNQASKLIQLKTNPLQLVRTFDLDPLKEFYPRLAMNAAKDQLYVLNSGVYQLHIESAETGERLIKGNGKNFYGLGINQLNQDIIISEIIDFNSPALIHIYNRKGEAIKTNIKGGIITSQFVN